MEEFIEDEQTLRSRWDKMIDQHIKELAQKNWCIQKLKTHQGRRHQLVQMNQRLSKTKPWKDSSTEKTIFHLYMLHKTHLHFLKHMHSRIHLALRLFFLINNSGIKYHNLTVLSPNVQGIRRWFNNPNVVPRREGATQTISRKKLGMHKFKGKQFDLVYFD